MENEQNNSINYLVQGRSRLPIILCSAESSKENSIQSPLYQLRFLDTFIGR